MGISPSGPIDSPCVYSAKYVPSCRYSRLSDACNDHEKNNQRLPRERFYQGRISKHGLNGRGQLVGITFRGVLWAIWTSLSNDRLWSRACENACRMRSSKKSILQIALYRLVATRQGESDTRKPSTFAFSHVLGRASSHSFNLGGGVEIDASGISRPRSGRPICLKATAHLTNVRPSTTSLDATSKFRT